VGDTCVGARVNGRLLPLRHVLQNGDQVEIMTTRGGTPSAQWERFCVTGKARARIRRYVHQQQRTQNIDQGRAALAKAFRQEGLDGSEKVLESALKTLKLASVADLYAAVGSGNIGPKDTVHAAYPQLKQAPRAPRMLPSMAPTVASPTRSTRSSETRADGMAITGLVSNMAVSYAGCCHPLPGEAITGIITTGKGVTIHTRNCQNLEAFAATPERFIDVDWEFAGLAHDRHATHTARISVTATNEPTALANLANAIAKQEASVNNLRIINRQQDFFEIMVDVEVRDLRHLMSVIAGLRATPSITEVERSRG
jgi:GTP pyrophosphokinase